MVGDYPVTEVSELVQNPECAETVLNLESVGGSGYYDCGLWGSHLIMHNKASGQPLYIMEIKAWSW